LALGLIVLVTAKLRNFCNIAAKKCCKNPAGNAKNIGRVCHNEVTPIYVEKALL